MDNALQRDGDAVRRKVLSDEHINRALSNSDRFGAPFQELASEDCWGTCRTDEGSDRRQCILLNLGMPAALGHIHEFALHLRDGIRNRLSEAELQAALMQIVIYCGIPAGVECFRIARQRAEMAESGVQA